MIIHLAHARTSAVLPPLLHTRTYGAGDGARGEEIAGAHVAAGHGVVGKLLLHRPVHVPGKKKRREAVLSIDILPNICMLIGSECVN